MFQVPSTVNKVTTMSDGGLRLVVDTQELDADEKAKVMGLHNKIGYFVFKESDIKEVDVLDLPDIVLDQGEKPPGQRLRATLYILWNQGDKQKQFEVFYRERMESLIDMIKNKLN